MGKITTRAFVIFLGSFAIFIDSISMHTYDYDDDTTEIDCNNPAKFNCSAWDETSLDGTGRDKHRITGTLNVNMDEENNYDTTTLTTIKTTTAKTTTPTTTTTTTTTTSTVTTPTKTTPTKATVTYQTTTPGGENRTSSTDISTWIRQFPVLPNDDDVIASNTSTEIPPTQIVGSNPNSNNVSQLTSPSPPPPTSATTMTQNQSQQNPSTTPGSPSDSTSTLTIPTTTNAITSTTSGAQHSSFPCNFNSSQNPCATEIQIIQNPFLFSKWGYGFFNDTPNFFINPKNYCVKNSTSVEICGQVLTSNPDEIPIPSISDSYFPPTLQKCCPLKGYLKIQETDKAKCSSSKDPPWKPEFMKNRGIYPNYNFNPPPCSELFFILPHQLEGKIEREKDSPITFKDVRVLENGQVETRDTGNHKWEKQKSNKYCIDGFGHVNLTKDKSTEEQWNKISGKQFILLQCKPVELGSKEIKDLIFTVASFISSFVLLLIVVVFGLVWNQQNIHGWTSGAFSFSMFLWFFCTFVRFVYQMDDENDGFCKFIAVATHFFRISVFSWMLVMNFDLWSTISSMTAKSQRSKGHGRFLLYCCVALAIPTIVVTISLIIEHKFSLFDDQVIRPQYGRVRCYLDRTAVPAHAIYPSIILFLPNLIFIFLTLKFLMGAKKHTQKFRDSTNWKATAAQNKKDRAQTILYIKLFVIMGISWIFDIISGLSDSDAGEVSWYWLIFDIYNIFQPFLLFWLFICKITIREQLSEKYSLCKAGFKWLDLHLPRYFSTRSTREKSESRSTKSTTFTTVTTIREEKYV